MSNASFIFIGVMFVSFLFQSLVCGGLLKIFKSKKIALKQILICSGISVAPFLIVLLLDSHNAGPEAFFSSAIFILIPIALVVSWLGVYIYSGIEMKLSTIKKIILSTVMASSNGVVLGILFILTLMVAVTLR